MSTVLLICPGKVPVNVCVRLIFCNIGKNLGKRRVGCCNTAASACLLNCDDVPFFAVKCFLNAVIGSRGPLAACVFIVSVRVLVTIDICPVSSKSAAAYVEVSNGDVLYAAILGNVREVFCSIGREAVTDGKNLERFCCGNNFGV